ncbi:MAG: hypothetical protein ACK557_00100, partial [Planctomycetota bacterium]
MKSTMRIGAAVLNPTEDFSEIMLNPREIHLVNEAYVVLAGVRLRVTSQLKNAARAKPIAQVHISK